MPELNVEIFAVGTWNGLKFTKSDLVDISENFDTLKDVQDVPLKFGHNKKQPMLDGQPAIGWIDKVWVQGEKLMAHFIDVPKLVADAFKKKLYKNVSVEILFGVKHEGKKYLNVLDAVALLGADRPAVSTLAELTTLMTRNSLESREMMVFSSVHGNFNKEDIDMNELETVQAQLKAEKEAREKADANAVKFSAENKTLKEDAKKAEDEAKKTAADTKRGEVKAVFDAAVKAETILPAQREAQYKLINIDDDDAVVALDIDVIKMSMNTKPAANFSKEDGESGGEDDKGKRKFDDAGEELTSRARATMSKDKVETFSDAFDMEMDKDPELAKEYIEGGE